MKIIFTFWLCCVAFVANAQLHSIHGVVTSDDGAPASGAMVQVRGTNTIAVTNALGEYAVSAKEGDTLVFTLLGFVDREVIVGTSTTINVVLQADATTIDDLVVVGYGVQKKSVVTAAIGSVKASDLQSQTPTRIESVLQGKIAGVNIVQSSGQPGSGSTVRIRGIGSTGNNDPLYVVDGMQVGGGIDYLNPTDIESIEVLKDAASAAVYGTKGSNGVILVTTKRGTQGDARVTYDFQHGWQNPWKLRPVLNSFEYQTIMNEMALQTGLTPGEDLPYPDPSVYKHDTNWQKELFNFDAPMQNHQLSVSGATERANYYVSLGYFTQDGVIGGNYNASNYDRLTLRLNNTYKLMDKSASRDWLAKANLGIQAQYAHINNRGIGTNDFFGGPLSHALTIPPIEGLYMGDTAEEMQEFLDYVATLTKAPPIMDKQGRPFNTVEGYTSEMSNPIASMHMPQQRNWSDKFVSSFWADLEIFKGLTFKSSYGVDMAFWGNNRYSRPYYRKYTDFPDEAEWDSASSAGAEFNRGFDWQVENTLTYANTFGKHNLVVLLGQSARGNKSATNLNGTRQTLPEWAWNDDKAWISSATATTGTLSGGPVNPYRLASYFGRVSYNFDERYLFEFTLRHDGSTRFGTNNKWATFPAVSAGWNITNESFAESFPSWISALKLRASWGQNGNDRINDFLYTVAMDSGNQSRYIWGRGGANNIFVGSKPSGIGNPDLKWEASEQTDIGLEASFFNSSLNFSIDWYQKNTKGMLIVMSNVPSYVGDSKPTGNVGTMFNTGIEIEADYRFVRGRWSFGVSANATYLKNRVENLGTSDGTQGGPSGNQSLGMVARSENGLPFNHFYGRKTDGIFQTWEEIESYTWTGMISSPTKKDPDRMIEVTRLIQPDAAPGDLRFVDMDNNGVINENDRTMIGNYFPKWTYNFAIDAAWNGIDVAMLWQGVADVDIFDATRRLDAATINLPAYALDRWTGPGTSNTIPRLVTTDKNGNWLPSDLYVQNGNYLRLKSLQIGYTLPARITKTALISKLRIYFMAENLLTITKYRGFDPEIPEGIDRGIYPQARTLSVGVNLAF